MINDSKEHLQSVNETYFKHFKTSFKIGLLMIIGGCEAIIHSIHPGILKTAASDKIKNLYKLVSGRS